MPSERGGKILGLNCFGHEASACILRDGQLVAMAEEERFNREKHTTAYPFHAIEYCLREAGITIDQIDHVAFFIRPWTWLRTQVRNGLAHLPASLNLLRGDNSGYPITARIRGALGLAALIAARHGARHPRFRVHYVDHHIAHACSAFLVSEFDRAAILCIDGWGDEHTTIVASGHGHVIERCAAVRFPHSLGGLYSTITEYLGFRNSTDEYKVMGLSAYGRPAYYDFFTTLVRFGRPGTFTLDLTYFAYHTHGHRRWWSDALASELGPPRERGGEITQRHKDIACSLQMVLEASVRQLACDAHELTGSENLCYAGGVALNCLANRRLLPETPFRRVFIQPVATDAGTSLGSALSVHFALNPDAPRSFQWQHPYWGPGFTNEECEAALRRSGLHFTKPDALVHDVAKAIADGKVVGWFQGRMESGPRALGNRSLLADPRRKDMKDLLNSRVKKREEFRPFAPSVLEERAHEFFALQTPSPYMMIVADVLPEKRHVIPACTHVDGTARVQTVSRHVNPRYWDLIREFGAMTGVPVLLNTSFNENEPIVCRPEEAIDCFRRTQIDLLVLNDFVVEREGRRAPADGPVAE